MGCYLPRSTRSIDLFTRKLYSFVRSSPPVEVIQAAYVYRRHIKPTSTGTTVSSINSLPSHCLLPSPHPLYGSFAFPITTLPSLAAFHTTKMSLPTITSTTTTTLCLLFAFLLTPTYAINLGPVDFEATSYLNYSLGDCSACYSNDLGSRCHRVAIGIYLRDLGLKTNPPSVSPNDGLSLISSDVTALETRATDFQFNSLVCRGFYRLVISIARTLDALRRPDRNLYEVAGAADLFESELSGTTVTFEISQVAADGALSIFGGRFIIKGTTVNTVQQRLTTLFSSPAWTQSQFSSDVSTVLLGPKDDNSVEMVIPFK